LVGIEGMTFMANAPEYKNLVSLALKRNRLGDSGVKVLSQSDTFKHVELLSLWENGITAVGAEMVANSANFRNLKDLNLASNHIGDEGVQILIPFAAFGKKLLDRPVDHFLRTALVKIAGQNECHLRVAARFFIAGK